MDDLHSELLSSVMLRTSNASALWPRILKTYFLDSPFQRRGHNEP